MPLALVLPSASFRFILNSYVLMLLALQRVDMNLSGFEVRRTEVQLQREAVRSCVFHVSRSAIKYWISALQLL